MGGYLSDPLPVSMAVLQGSILSPSVAESGETNMFVDDTEIDTAEKPESHEDLKNV